MRDRWLLVTSMLLLSFGLLGLAWLSVALAPPAGTEKLRSGLTDEGPRRSPYGGPRSDYPVDLGERIFLFGVGEDGAVPRTAVGPGMMSGGCADCHGKDGRGRAIRMMMGELRAPDIRLDTLLSDPEEPFDSRDDVARAITLGLEPDGERLDEFMPRWKPTRSEMQALLEYLEELSQR